MIAWCENHLSKEESFVHHNQWIMIFFWSKKPCCEIMMEVMVNCRDKTKELWISHNYLTMILINWLPDIWCKILRLYWFYRHKTKLRLARIEFQKIEFSMYKIKELKIVSNKISKFWTHQSSIWSKSCEAILLKSSYLLWNREKYN